MKELNRQIYSFDNFQLDTGNRQLRRDDKPLSLPAKALDLLLALVENKGRLMEKDELFTSVWQDQIVEESNLTVHISQIRKALGETTKNPRFIETVQGYGYRFVGDVQNLEDSEIVIETQTLSRITIEEGVKGRKGEGVNFGDTKSFTLSPLHPLTLSQKLAVGAFVILVIIGGGFWLSNRNQNKVANAPVVLTEKQSNIKRLTSKGEVNHAVLSPDGKFFVYSLGERGSYRSSLWLGQTNGNSDVQLQPADDLTYHPRSFSADGNWLYYTASEPRSFNNGTLYKMPTLGGVPQKLASGISVYAALSPDEKQIAFARGNRENKTESLVVANLDGSGEREITARPAATQGINSQSLSWSADGALVAFGAESGKGDSQEIFTANTADGTITQLTALDWTGLVRVQWRRDGGGLLAVARDKNSIVDRQLWQIEYPSGKAQKITRDLQHYATTLSLSADSNQLLAVQSFIESHIWIAPAENLAAARQLTFGSSAIAGWNGIDWTADGRIIYAARVDQSLTIWTMDADGGHARQLTPAGFQDYRPSVTADGRFIVFQSNRSGKLEIWRVETNGGNLRQITFDGKNSYPHSTPDGKWIVYQHGGDDGENSVWRVSIEGGEAVRITGKQSSNPRVSPDGNFIACGYAENGKTKLAVFPIEGGEPVKLFDIPPTYNFNGSIRWTRDGRFISYRDWKNGVWSQSVDGGEPKRLEGLPAEKLYHYEWSPDGKQFAFTRGREVRDVVLLTDFR